MNAWKTASLDFQVEAEGWGKTSILGELDEMGRPSSSLRTHCSGTFEVFGSVQPPKQATFAGVRQLTRAWANSQTNCTFAKSE